MRYTFTKEERLKSQKAIGKLFREGQTFGIFPLRLIWLEMEEVQSAAPVQFAVSVSKKKFKSAVARNRIKRKVREAWRLHKHRLYQGLEGTPGQFAFMVLYTANEELPFAQIEKALKTAIWLFLKKRKEVA